MSVFDILALFGGLALFLYGMRVMGSALREGASGTLKNVLQKMTNNVIKGFLLGLLMTAVIQSSTATIVITSGLVAAGILSLRQSLGIIIGANVGTTVTGQIIRLLDLNNSSTAWLQLFKPDTLAPVALIIGIVIIMFLKFRKSETIGNIAVGFGILFTGLINMTAAVSAVSTSPAVQEALTKISGSPFFGYGVGSVMSFILQSSSASVGILQSFSVSGLLQFKGIYAVLLGIYLGDCVTTAIVCMIGAKPDAKRVAVINIIFNLCKTVIVLAGVLLAHSFGLLDAVWEEPLNSGGIANWNTVFNIIPALLMLPMIPTYDKLSHKLIPDEPAEVNPFEEKLAGLSPKFFQTPAIGFYSSYEVLLAMFDTARANFQRAFSLFEDFDQKEFDEIKKNEEYIDLMADRTSQYLVQFSSHVTEESHANTMTQYYQLISEFERLGDHALNIAEGAQKMKEEGLLISEEGRKELQTLRELLNEVFETTRQAFVTSDVDIADRIEPLEEVVDDLIDYLRDAHLRRLTTGACTPEIDTIYINLLSDLERLSDICANVAVSIIVRIRPQLASESHDYIRSLHTGVDEKFNERYQAAHETYFSQLMK